MLIPLFPFSISCCAASGSPQQLLLRSSPPAARVRSCLWIGCCACNSFWGIFFVGSNSENMNLLGRSAGVSCVPKAPRETGVRQNKKGSPRNHSFVHANRAWHQHGEVSAVEREPSGCSPITGWIFSLFPTFHCHLLALTERLLRWPWSKYLR